MNKHTPGPWKVEPTPRLQNTRIVFMPKDRIEVTNATGSLVACLYGTNFSMDGEKDRGNARLIAAAPELKDALKAVAPFCPEEVRDKIDALLARIEGE